MMYSIFSIFGYASVLLWLVAILLLVLHFRRRPRRWFCHYAVVAALVALVLAEINSRTYVNHLQVDQSEAIAAAQARQEKARRMAEEERADDVAQIRFAEDDQTDFLDMGGLDDADRKYIESMTEDTTPAWKQQKQERSTMAAEEESLDAQLDTSEQAGGVEGETLRQETREAVVLPERMVRLANRLDGLNLKWIRFLLLAGLVGVVVDYLQRANRVEDAYFPLPLPSKAPHSFTPLPVVCQLPASHPRTMIAELAWLVRRGETFVYLTGDAQHAEVVPEQLPRLPGHACMLDVLQVADQDALLDDTFVFEGVWYNRAAFVIGSIDRAESFLTTLYDKLMEYRSTRARVRQTVHIVWDLENALHDALQEDVINLLGTAGFSIRDVSALQGVRMPRNAPG